MRDVAGPGKGCRAVAGYLIEEVGAIGGHGGLGCFQRWR